MRKSRNSKVNVEVTERRTESELEFSVSELRFADASSKKEVKKAHGE